MLKSNNEELKGFTNDTETNKIVFNYRTVKMVCALMADRYEDSQQPPHEIETHQTLRRFSGTIRPRRTTLSRTTSLWWTTLTLASLTMSVAPTTTTAFVVQGVSGRNRGRVVESSSSSSSLFGGPSSTVESPRRISPLTPSASAATATNATDGGVAVAPAMRAVSPPPAQKRPRGRQDSVAGATSRGTLKAMREAEALSDGLVSAGRLNPRDRARIVEMVLQDRKDNELTEYYDRLVNHVDGEKDEKEVETETESVTTTSTPTSFFEGAREVEGVWGGDDDASVSPSAVVADQKDTTPPKRKRGRPRKKVDNDDGVAEAARAAAAPERKRKPVRAIGRSKYVRKKGAAKRKRGKSRGDIVSLQKYYDTELLTPFEEYSFSMQVHFLTKCEFVYEGITVDRNPTIAEWAYACGFQEADFHSAEDYVETPLESTLRPSAHSVDDDDNDDSLDNSVFFKGNGLEKTNGVGRGNGRKTAPPPTSLKPFADDTYEKFPNHEDFAPENDHFLAKQLKRCRDGGPINYGTPSDFVDMLLSAKEAKRRMVECNMRLVVSIARHYSNVGVNVQDLVQECSLGLVRAAEKFDPRKGFKFSTYASWWIQQAVFRGIANYSRNIRLPVHVHNLLNRVRRVRAQLQQDLGRSPTDAEVADELGMTRKKFERMMILTRNTVSLENPKYKQNPKDHGHMSEMLLVDSVVVGDDGNTNTDDGRVVTSTAEQKVDVRLFQDDLRDMMQMLEDDERLVISARYGLDDGLTRTVTAVAVELGKSKAWVRSQESRGMRKLRRPWYEKRLLEHQNSLLTR